VSWGKNIEQFTPPDLEVRSRRLTAMGKQTKAYFPHERRLLRFNPYRRLLLSTIFQAAADYHKAKRICKDKRVKTDEDFHRLQKETRQFVMNGWKAHEWFTQEPAGESPNKITFAQVCSLFGVDPKKLWRKIKTTPDIAVMLGELRTPECG
jgi:hypothetical protein